MTDLHRPRYHFTPRENWMNDPNGLVYFDGEYHLFFQYSLPRHWGHAVSHDLVHWQELPIGISPDELGEIWSGSAVVDWYNTTGLFAEKPGLAALFTHWNRGVQVQSLASSDDAGRTWQKYARNPVLPNPGHADFRDPKVFWHEPTARWVMALAAGDHIQFYCSPDLLVWSFASEFRAEIGPRAAGVWECPDLVELPIEAEDDHAWVLHLSTSGPDGSYMHTFIGTFDGTTFQAESHVVADYGEEFYAGVTWSGIPHDHDRVLWIGWMNNWRYANAITTSPWQGAMTIPRELRLIRTAAGLRLAQRPVRELVAKRGELFHLAGVRAAGTYAIPVASAAFEMIVELRPEQANTFGLAVRVGNGQRTIVGYDVSGEQLFIDRRESGQVFHPSFPGVHTAPLALDDGLLRLHIFVDTCSVEVFAAHGTIVLTDLIFPDPEATGLAMYAEGIVEIVSLEIYPL